MRGRLVFSSANADRKESTHDYVRSCNRYAGVLCRGSVHDVAPLPAQRYAGVPSKQGAPCSFEVMVA